MTTVEICAKKDQYQMFYLDIKELGSIGHSVAQPFHGPTLGTSVDKLFRDLNINPSKVTHEGMYEHHTITEEEFQRLLSDTYFKKLSGKIQLYKTPPARLEYGAPVGRRNDNIQTGTIRLQKLPVNSGGYDRGGHYFGAPFWAAQDEYANQCFLSGALSREAAAKKIREMYPKEELKFRGLI